MSLGFGEIVLILVVALLFFGPSRLPGLGKSVGEAIRGFKKGIEGLDEEVKPQHHARTEHLPPSSPSEPSSTNTTAKDPTGTRGSDHT